MRSFEYVHAQSLQEAVAQLKEPGTVVKAGGVDLLDLMKEGLVAPMRLVNLRTVKDKGLDAIRDAGKEGLRIGPLVTLAQIEADHTLQKRYPALAQAAAHAATPQIRNMATLGGNLLQRPRCWYFRLSDFKCRKRGGSECYALNSDGENQFHAVIGNRLCAMIQPSTLSTALVALSARVRLTGPGGDRELPLEEFYTLPEKDVTRENVLSRDELISEIVLPVTRARSAYHKQVEKESFDWPLAEVAVALEIEGNRCGKAQVVLGAAAPIPWRARAAEAVLSGKAIDERVAAEAARAALQGATPLSQNGYKLPVFQAIVRRTILAAAGGAS